MRDPYQVLGVAKDASQKDIKSAYRKLAKKHHPDQNPDDPKAQEQFAEVNQAYEIVGDDKTRKAYDRGEIDATGKQRFQDFGQGFAGARRRSVRRLPALGAGPGRDAISSSAPPARATARRTSSASFSARPLRAARTSAAPAAAHAAARRRPTSA